MLLLYFSNSHSHAWGYGMHESPTIKVLTNDNDLSKGPNKFWDAIRKIAVAFFGANKFWDAIRKIAVAFFSFEELETCTVLGQNTASRADPRLSLLSQKKSIYCD